MGPTTAKNIAASLAAGDSWVELLQTFFLLFIYAALISLFLTETCRRMSAAGWRIRALTDDAPTKIIWALGVTYTATLMDRVWLLLRHFKIGDEWLHAVIAVVALLLYTWSAGCILRVFSGVVWGKRAWMWIVGLAAVGATLAMLATDFLPG